MSLYPFNEFHVQVGADRCPAPWCGDAMGWANRWSTPVEFDGDFCISFRAAAVDLGAAGPLHALDTCRRPDCRYWARLRAEDLRSTANEERSAHLMATRPHPLMPEDLALARLERTLRDSVERIQELLRPRRT